jgi:hypothetical protein
VNTELQGTNIDYKTEARAAFDDAGLVIAWSHRSSDGAVRSYGRRKEAADGWTPIHELAAEQDEATQVSVVSRVGDLGAQVLFTNEYRMSSRYAYTCEWAGSGWSDAVQIDTPELSLAERTNGDMLVLQRIVGDVDATAQFFVAE